MALNLGSFGSFLGGTNGQGGLAAQLQQQSQQAQQKDQMAKLYQALAAAQQQGSPNGVPPIPGAAPGAPPAPPALPGSAAVPPSAVGVPAGKPVGSPGAAPAPNPGIAPLPGGMPPSPGASGGVPSMEKIMAAVANMPNLRDDQKMQILEQAGAFITPYEKMTQQMELKTQQLQAQSQRAQDMMDNARTIASMRIGAQERGQDIASSDKAAARTQQYDKMSGVDLRGELNSITQQLSNNPKLSADERKDLMAQWQEVKTALDGKRKKQGLDPSSEKSPEATAGSNGAVPADAPTATSADGKKVYWDGTSWKPVAGGQ